ncbi:MAG: Kinase inhibitor [Actinomycetota bacterium]|jgi:KipI family sensor histidine kinase inhibitor
MVELDDPEAPAVLRAALAADVAVRGAAIDVVPAARTLLVTHEPGATAAVREAMERAVAGLGIAARPAASAAPLVEVPVVYDGEDLAEVASRVGRSVAEVVAMHAGAEYRVAFCGFAPGFAYLRGLDARLVLPRRATPRPRVPAGSVAIAAEYSAVYPGASPGGWHLLGTTRMAMWDASRADAPAVLVPGMRVRFVPEAR